jgi:positive regulator of sigma E activity
MTARGVVRKSSGGCVEVELAAPPACRGCEGLCLWRRLPASRRIELAARTALAEGDLVVVALPPRYLLLGALFVHGLPLAALLGGALVGLALGASDFAAVLGAAAGLGLALAAAPPLRRRLEAVTLRAMAVAPERLP